ncbi:MAG: NUDIX domain-containing protein [Desulfococcaceae bacterium]
MAVLVHERTPVHRGRVFEMIRERVTLDNGVTTELDLIRHPGAAAMVPMPDPETVILLRQYRHAVGTSLWEIPAGTLEPGEDPLDGAKREIVEEIGYSADRWEKLGEIVPVPGYADERIHLFLAESLRPAQQALDADEVIEVHTFPLGNVWEMVDAGEIQDAKTLGGLLHLARRRNRAR